MGHAAVAEDKDETLLGFIKKFLCYHKSSYRNCYSLYRPDMPWNYPPPYEIEPASALYYSSFGGMVITVKYLLSQGADVNAPGGRYGTALQAASGEGHERLVELLLSNGADVNAIDGGLSTALQVASRGGHERVVKLLLSNGADVNSPGVNDTPLLVASRGGHERLVELLLR